MAVDTSKGFKYMGRASGQPDWFRKFYFKDTESFHIGDVLNLESGEVDLGATADTGLLGICMENKDGTDSTTEVEVCIAPDALYSVYDANARAVGDTLDIAGTTGQQTVATSSNKEFVVVGGVSASDRTIVMINPKKHALAKEVS